MTVSPTRCARWSADAFEGMAEDAADAGAGEVGGLGDGADRDAVGEGLADGACRGAASASATASRSVISSLAAAVTSSKAIDARRYPANATVLVFPGGRTVGWG